MDWCLHWFSFGDSNLSFFRPIITILIVITNILMNYPLTNIKANRIHMSLKPLIT